MGIKVIYSTLRAAIVVLRAALFLLFIILEHEYCSRLIIDVMALFLPFIIIELK